MFQCLGLAGESEGGCGEDWWHPECVLGLGRGWNQRRKAATETRRNPSDSAAGEADEDHEEDQAHEESPPGFPLEDDFETFICYKCVDTEPWIKRYAGSTGFLLPVIKACRPPPANEHHAAREKSGKGVQNGKAQ